MNLVENETLLVGRILMTEPQYLLSLDGETDLTPLVPRPKAGIMDIAAYVGGKSKIDGVAEPIKLSSNENALGASALALDAYDQARSQIFRYPDGRATPLRAQVSQIMGLEADRLVFGNGSDEVFSILNQAYLGAGDSLVTGIHGFLAYRISALACQAQVRLVAEPDFRLSVDHLLAGVDETTKIVIISNPGNPTGTWLSHGDIERLESELPPHILFVVDEAYAEFVDAPDWQSAFGLARHSQRMVVTRTFSKIHGLGGLRVGYGYCPPSVIEALERIRLPFNINSAAQSAALAALKDTAHQEASRNLVLKWRPRFYQRLRALGIEVSPSQGNFVLARFKDAEQAQSMNDYLMQKGIIVRHVANYGISEGLRITIGKDHENEAILDAISAFGE